MKSKIKDSKLEAVLQDNANILSRFTWSTSSSYKKFMVIIFIFLIFLFLLRYPIMKWINEIPEPPIIELGECEVKGQGQLEISHVHLTPSSNSGGVIISFSTNLATNSLIAVQYGTDSKMEFEAFATVSEIPSSNSHYPYIYYASIIIASPGHQYFYRVSCATVHSDMYSFHSWRSGNGWSPNIALVSGTLAQDTINTLVHKKHKLSLVAHIDSYTQNEHSDKYLAQVQHLAAEVPFLLLPADKGFVKSSYYSRLYPLPGAEWPVTKDTFHTIVGPMIVIGFNSRELDSSMPWLREAFMSITALRSKFPWLVVLSLDESFCLPTKTISPPAATCQHLFDLFTQYKVDLYVTGVSTGYHRTWPLAMDGSALSTYHSASGFVSVALGVKEETKTSPSLLISNHLMKNDSSVQNTYMNIEFTSPGSMCMQAINSHSHAPVDQFCIEKKVHFDTAAAGGVLSVGGGTYDLTTWLCLVIILSVVFIALIVFRRALYGGVCKYMESDGGIPLYEGKLMTV